VIFIHPAQLPGPAAPGIPPYAVDFLLDTTLPSLLTFAEPDHVLFGSDWPHAPKQVGAFFESMYEQYPLSETQRASIDRGAARKLFSRFADESGRGSDA
jgi:predicted TIM-barrel fold metal-dependent hydrolase